MESSRYYLETTFPPDSSSVHHTTHCPGHKTTTTVWTTTRVIGRGANGTVVLQTDPSGLVRAVKQVINSYSCTKEVAALSKVSDRRDLFVEFFGWYEDKDYLYIAMEFVADGDLGAYLKACGSSPPPEETCKAISRQLLKALKVLHERQICHRDLKPQNILVAALDPIRVKITDSGASKILVGTECRTRIGTSGYVAPEILGVWLPPRGRRPFFGPAVDMWAAGCVIHELLSLQIPFARKLQDPDPDEMVDEISGLDCHQEPAGTDMVQLMGYCQAQLPLPVEALAQSGASMESVEVVRVLLMADPESRATAPETLRYSWLSESRRPLALGADTGSAELYAPDSHLIDAGYLLVDTVILSSLDQDIPESLDTSRSLASWSAKTEAWNNIIRAKEGYNCAYPGCWRSFKYLSKLKDHLRKHTPPKFQCPQCKQMFKQERILKKHIFRIHKGDKLQGTTDSGAQA